MRIWLLGILLVILIPFNGICQPGGNPGQGGGPGGRNGNDPCLGANPHPKRSNVLIDEAIWVLLVGASLIAG